MPRNPRLIVMRPYPTFLPLFIVLAMSTSACSSWRVDLAARTATGFSSHLLCDDIFITGLDPQTAFAERLQPMPGLGLVDWGLQRHVDPVRREVTVSVAGAFASRAQFSEGLGCVVRLATELTAAPLPSAPLPAFVPRLPDIAVPDIVPGEYESMRAALGRAMPEHEGSLRHRTKAIVVMQHGRVIAERYASGFGVDTPVLGFSMTKSVTNALVGILVRQGRLSLDQPAPLTAWADPADPRHAITIEQLLRQTTGLDLPQDNSGFDISSQIMYTVPDKAAAAAGAALASNPGTRWTYSDTNYILLSRVLRDAAGGTAQDLQLFAYSQLFGPLGMRHVMLDFDTTGTPIGASHMLASARDWARFGQLYLDDGVVAGQRILPVGWVANSVTPTLATGYGAGWWTNRVEGLVPGWGVPWGLSRAPKDAFFARGYMGQFTVVIPSERMVVVRLSISHVRGDDIEETDRLVGDILAAVRQPPTATARARAMPPRDE